MQGEIQRLHLRPEPIDLGREVIGRHVVKRAPQDARVVEAELARALVGELDESLIARAHRCADAMPSLPHVQQLFRVAARRKNVGDLIDIEAFLFRAGAPAVLASAIFPFEPGSQTRQLVALDRIVGRRCGELKLYQFQLASVVLGQLQSFETAGAQCELRDGGGEVALRVGGDSFGVGRDEVVLDPRCT